MILRSAFGIGLVCLGMLHLSTTQMEAATGFCSTTRICADGAATDESQVRAAILGRLHDLKKEIGDNSNSPMVSDATAIGQNLHQLVQLLPSNVTGPSHF